MLKKAVSIVWSGERGEQTGSAKNIGSTGLRGVNLRFFFAFLGQSSAWYSLQFACKCQLYSRGAVSCISSAFGSLQGPLMPRSRVSNLDGCKSHNHFLKSETKEWDREGEYFRGYMVYKLSHMVFLLNNWLSLNLSYDHVWSSSLMIRWTK